MVRKRIKHSHVDSKQAGIDQKSPYKHRGYKIWEPGCISCANKRSPKWYAYSWNQVDELQTYGVNVVLGKFKNGTVAVVPRSCGACDRRFSGLGIARKVNPKGKNTSDDGVDDASTEAVFMVHDQEEENKENI